MGISLKLSKLPTEMSIGQLKRPVTRICSSAIVNPDVLKACIGRNQGVSSGLIYTRRKFMRRVGASSYRMPSMDILSKVHSKRGRESRHSSKCIHKNTERGLNFVVVRQPAMRQGRLREWPRLFLIRPISENDVEVACCELLDVYFDENHARSQQWRRETCEAVGLLVDHTHAVLPLLSEEQREASDESLERLLLRSFAIGLVNGTTTLCNGRRVDPTGLFWRGKGSRRAGRLLARLTHLFRSFEADGSGRRWQQAASTEKLKHDPLVALRVAVELGIRRKNSLLGHLDGKGKETPSPFPGIVKSDSQHFRPVYAFPSKYVVPFLCEGFTNTNGVVDETAELVALLLFCGGLRVSEPFHAFVSDVQFVGKRPWLFLHHPEDGNVRDHDGNNIRRADYLHQFSMVARTLNETREHAGWKGIAGDDLGAPAYWLPIEPLVDRLYAKLRRYVLVTRPAIMKRRPKSLGDHPFLLVSSGLTALRGDGNVGDPYAIAAFLEAWKAGVKRISKRYDEPELVLAKKRGTTCHGARHHYGKYLRAIGITADLIQQCMHHKHPDSHKIYTRLTPAETNTVLQGGELSDLGMEIRTSFEEAFLHYESCTLSREIR